MYLETKDYYMHERERERGGGEGKVEGGGRVSERRGKNRDVVGGST